MSEIAELTRRIGLVEAENKQQSTKLDDALTLLKRVDLSLTGDPERGITGIVATAKSAHRRLDEEVKAREGFERSAVHRMVAIEEAAAKERWMGRIGSGVVGAGFTGFCVWAKHKLGWGE